MSACHIGVLALAALAEILGCYLAYLCLRLAHSNWYLIPAAMSLALFAGLVAHVTQVSGRTYAIYGIVYVAISLGWLWIVDGIQPTRTDLVGVAIALAGMIVVLKGMRV